MGRDGGGTVKGKICEETQKKRREGRKEEGTNKRSLGGRLGNE